MMKLTNALVRVLVIEIFSMSRAEVTARVPRPLPEVGGAALVVGSRTGGRSHGGIPWSLRGRAADIAKTPRLRIPN